MLLKFEVENYKSFKDKTVFSMIPAPKQKGLDYSILQENIASKKYKSLSSAVIYGPNTSGKTNIIGAIQTLKNIILRGHIRNTQINSINPADNYLELIPNNTLTERKNTFFSISFIKDNLLIKYSISLDLGLFLQKDYQRKICKEELVINDKVIFLRQNNNIKLDNLKIIEKFLLSNFNKKFDVSNLILIIQNSLTDEDLFLLNGFKNIISSKLTDFICSYFNDNLDIIYHADQINTIPNFSPEITKYMNKAIMEFGINSNELVYVKSKQDSMPTLCSKLDNNKYIPAETFESYGTVRFVNLFPIIANALKKGTTVIIDEFDSSIHPMAIINLIGIFHNDEININHAQLIFNTHNPLYLNYNILRRDEIKFIDRDEDSKCSLHYSLSDFGTKGTNARKGKDYMNNYFVSAYGAIRDIDFSDIFEKITKGGDNAETTK